MTVAQDFMRCEIVERQLVLDTQQLQNSLEKMIRGHEEDAFYEGCQRRGLRAPSSPGFNPEE